MNFEQMLHIGLFSLILTQGNAHCKLLLLRHFNCVSYIYMHVQQNQLSNHTNIDGIGGCGGGVVWGQYDDRYDFNS